MEALLLGVAWAAAIILIAIVLTDHGPRGGGRGAY